MKAHHQPRRDTAEARRDYEYNRAARWLRNRAGTPPRHIATMITKHLRHLRAAKLIQ